VVRTRPSPVNKSGEPFEIDQSLIRSCLYFSGVVGVCFMQKEEEQEEQLQEQQQQEQ